MRKLLATLMIFFLFVALSPMVVQAASPCPPEVQAAKNMLTKQVAKSQDVQAPRSLAGARSQDVQAPRSQDIQAPRGQDVQAPRAGTTGGTMAQAPRAEKARILVNEAEAACKAGDMTKATEKAKAAMVILKQK